jgi:DnaK suppressor protein
MERADLQRYRNRLLEKQQELLYEKPVAEAPVLGAGGGEGDLGDQAKADAEAELQIRLHQSGGRLLRAIDDALARMRKGTYGVCEVCRRPISKVRLEAVPWARLCRECKEEEHPAA